MNVPTSSTQCPFTLFACLCGPSVACTRRGVQLTTWDVEVWPEYDKPSVLVIYHGQWPKERLSRRRCAFLCLLASQSTRSPMSMQRGGCLRFRGEVRPLKKDKQWCSTLKSPISSSNSTPMSSLLPLDRSFELSLSAPYAAQEGALSLRQPSRASDMQITPAMAQTGTDSLGNPVVQPTVGSARCWPGNPLECQPIPSQTLIPLSVQPTSLSPQDSRPDKSGAGHGHARVAALAGRWTGGRAGRGDWGLSAVAVAATK